MSLITGDDGQNIWDILLYSTHSDPQMKVQVSGIISSFISRVVSLSSAGYSQFLMSKCPSSSFSSAPSLEDVMRRLYHDIILDPKKSSLAIRSGISSFSSCLHPILKSNETINSTAVSMNRTIIQSFSSHSYWLIRIELLKLVSIIPFKQISYIESVQNQNHARKGSKMYLLPLQEVVLSVLMDMMTESDHRVQSVFPFIYIGIIPNLVHSGFNSWFSDP